MIAKREKEHPTGRYSEMDVDAAWETFQTEYRPLLIPPFYYVYVRNALNRDNFFHSWENFFCITILLGLMTFTAYAMGYDLWAVVAQWTKDTFTFVSASKAKYNIQMALEPKI